MPFSLDEERRKIPELLAEGFQKQAAEIIWLRFDNADHGKQRALLKYVDQFSDPVILFDLILSVYTLDGYNFPKSLIRKAKSIAKQIPDDYRLSGLPDGDPVTIWRGTSVINPDCENVLRTAVSWTTDRPTAIWFANRITSPFSKTGHGAVWEGSIDREKIIAFTQDRNESEVLQYMNVKSVHLLELTDKDWADGLKAYDDRRKAEESDIFT